MNNLIQLLSLGWRCGYPRYVPGLPQRGRAIRRADWGTSARLPRCCLGKCKSRHERRLWCRYQLLSDIFRLGKALFYFFGRRRLTQESKNIPDGVDMPIRLSITPSAISSNFRAQIYLNGWQIGKYINNIG